jgi:hypothetical protein
MIFIKKQANEHGQQLRRPLPPFTPCWGRVGDGGIIGYADHAASHIDGGNCTAKSSTANFPEIKRGNNAFFVFAKFSLTLNKFLIFSKI